MEVTLEEDTPSYSMVKKWAGEFKRGRKNLEDDPHLEDCTITHNARFCSFFLFQGLDGVRNR